MKKSKLILPSLALAASITGCDPKSAESTNSSTSEEEVTMSEEEQRPSPLRKISGEINGKSVKLQYGAPSVKGREVWGDLVPYNVVWRTGANEATYIEVTEAIEVEGKVLEPGKYSIFTIPKENQAWTVIFNSDWDLEHGHFQYNENNDVLRVKVTPSMGTESQEVLSFEIADPGIIVKWEKMTLTISIK